MSILGWILISTFSVSLISFVGVFTLVLKEDILYKITLPLVSLSAGALLGGAMLHMIPEAVETIGNTDMVWIWVLVGFSLFFLLEQFIHWHHCHKAPSKHKTPVTYLILIADGLHNFIDGLALAGSFLVSFKVGAITWIAIIAHEIPQEFGDFGVLIHGGWNKNKALWFNFFSGLTMVLGGVIAYYLSNSYDVRFLLPFAAGNFIYIAASDLIPEVKHSEKIKTNIIHFISFLTGVVIIFAVGTLE
ncbi:MAG: ZIP family metal transporter [Candidatus Paceibacterota bacterium]